MTLYQLHWLESDCLLGCAFESNLSTEEAVFCQTTRRNIRTHQSVTLPTWEPYIVQWTFKVLSLQSLSLFRNVNIHRVKRTQLGTVTGRAVLHKAATENVLNATWRTWHVSRSNRKVVTVHSAARGGKGGGQCVVNLDSDGGGWWASRSGRITTRKTEVTQ